MRQEARGEMLVDRSSEIEDRNNGLSPSQLRGWDIKDRR
jgi:hypothetical protein